MPAMQDGPGARSLEAADDVGGQAGVTTGDAAGQAAPPPAAAAAVFGPALPLAERYADLLAGPGIVRGLIGPREAGRLWERHLLNCAVVAELIPRPSSLVDIGSGAGLPGIVLAMLLPDVQVTLLEPMARRVTFLGECVAELNLGNVAIRRARAEEVAGEFAADVVTARAVAPLGRLAGLAVPLLRPGGTVLALKGEQAAAEAKAAGPELRRLGVSDVTVLQAGAGLISPATTVVRLVTGPRRRGPGSSSANRRAPRSRSRR
jgi:16S rRNA (guanine527-N7)-methyltransferase